MSTKSSIKYRERTTEDPGFHLYDNCFDRMEFAEDAPVYLCLEGVAVELLMQDASATVTIRIPRKTARALGLLPNTELT
jgi:hypothetical protein